MASSTTSTIRIRIDGAVQGLRRAAASAGSALAGLGRAAGQGLGAVAPAAALAGKALLIFAAVGVASGLVVGAAIMGAVLAIGGIGILAAAQSEQVKKAFTGLKDHVVSETKKLAKPIEESLLRIADRARGAFDRIAPSLGRMFKAVAPFIEQFADGLMKFVENLMPGFEAAIAAAAPVVKVFSDGLAGLGTAMSGFFKGMAAGAAGGAAAWKGLFDLINGLLPVLGRLLGALANAFGPAFAALTPVIVKIVEVVALFAEALGGVLGPILTGVIDMLAAFLMPVLEAIAGIIRDYIIPTAMAWGETFKSVFAAMQPLFVELGNLFGQIVEALRPLFDELMRLSLEAMPGIAEAIKTEVIPWIRDTLIPVIRDQLIPWIRDVLVPFIIDKLIPAIIDFAVWCKDTATKVSAAWNAIKQWIADAVARVKATIETIRSIPERVRAFFEQARQAIVDRFTAAIDWVKDFPNKVKNALGNLGNTLVAAGGALVDGFLGGIKAAWNRVTSYISGAVAGVRAYFPFSPAKKGAFSGRGYVSYSGRALTNDFAESLREGIPTVQAAASGLLRGAQGALSGSVQLGAGGSGAGLALSGAAGSGDLTVQVLIDGQEFKGMIRTAVDEDKRMTRRLVSSGSGRGA